MLAKKFFIGRNELGLDVSIVFVDEAGVNDGKELFVDELLIGVEEVSVEEVSSPDEIVDETIDDVLILVSIGGGTYGESPTCQTKFRVTLVSVPEVEKSAGINPPQYISVADAV
jgi:hypothetical protein